MMRNTRMRTVWEPTLYVMTGLGSIYIAVQYLPQPDRSFQGVFVYGWFAFAAIVIAANLWFLFGVDKERKVQSARRKARSVVFEATAQRAGLHRQQR